MPTVATHKAKPRAIPRMEYRRDDRSVSVGWIVIPSWLLSLALHVAALCLMAFTVYRPVGFGKSGAGETDTGIYAGLGTGPGLPGDGTGQPPGPGMGIFSGPAQDAAADGNASGGDATAEESDVAARRRQTSPAEQAIDEGPPVELDLPTAPRFAARVGAGARPFGESASDAREMIKSGGRTFAGARAGLLAGGGEGTAGRGGGGGTGGSGGGGGGSGGGGT